MPEVADGAGVLFNPRKPDEISRAMSDILLDSSLRGRLERLGTQRAALFSWQSSARATLDIYRDVMEEQRGVSLKPTTVASVPSNKR